MAKSNIVVEKGKLVYGGGDVKVEAAVARINRLGGFPVMEPGPKKKGALTDALTIIKPTEDNVDMINDYI